LFPKQAILYLDIDPPIFHHSKFHLLAAIPSSIRKEKLKGKIDGGRQKKQLGKARKGELIHTPWQTDANENNQGIASHETCVPLSSFLQQTYQSLIHMLVSATKKAGGG